MNHLKRSFIAFSLALLTSSGAQARTVKDDLMHLLEDAAFDAGKFAQATKDAVRSGVKVSREKAGRLLFKGLSQLVPGRVLSVTQTPEVPLDWKSLSQHYDVVVTSQKPVADAARRTVNLEVIQASFVDNDFFIIVLNPAKHNDVVLWVHNYCS